MKIRTIVIAATVLVLAGCSSTPVAEVVEPAPTASATHSPAPTPTPTPTAEPSPTSTATTPVVLTPPVDDETFLAALGTIDPGLAHERSLGRAANVCLDIEQGKDSMAVLVNMEARFEGGTVPDLSGGQLATLLRLIKATCD